VNDNDGLSDAHMPPGMGTTDFEPFIAALRDTNYTGSLSVEPRLGYSTDPDSAACFGLICLENVLGKTCHAS